MTFCEGSKPGSREVQIKIGFLPDTQCRFTSASFGVTFGYEDQVKGFVPIKIEHMSPVKHEFAATEAEHTMEAEVGATMALTGGNFGNASVDARRKGGLAFNRRTVAIVKGIGVDSATARWTFEENAGPGGQDGLEPLYELDVKLSKTGFITIRFWAKTVLIAGRERLLHLGTEEKPYIKHLNLSG